MGTFFYQVVRNWGGVILTIRKFFKTKNSIFVNTKHQLKSKLAWSVFQKSMKLNKNGTGAMTTAKNDVFILLLGWTDFWWEGIKIWRGGGEWPNFWLVGGLPHPPPPVGTTLYKLCHHVFIYNLEAPCISHTSCAKVAILLLQDLSTACHRYIWYIFSLAC